MGKARDGTLFRCACAKVCFFVFDCVRLSAMLTTWFQNNDERGNCYQHATEYARWARHL
jgi:hypothetical protein